jgi:hypothetical protein
MQTVEVGDRPEDWWQQQSTRLAEVEAVTAHRHGAECGDTNGQAVPSNGRTYDRTGD